VTRQNRLLLGVAAALAALAAYWFLLLAPKREEGAALATKVAQTQASVAQAETTLASYREAEGSYKTLYATVASLGKAVPADDDTRSLVVQLESAAAASGVDFHSIEVGTAGTSGDDATLADPSAAKLPPGAAAVGTAGFSAMSYDLEFKGSFLELSDLFSRLERFVQVDDDRLDVTGRLLRIEGLSMNGAEGDYRDLTATVHASTYLEPAGEGLTAGATAQAPAGTTSSTPATSADAGTTPPVTTATTTGALR
jgi:hypothetical protein